MLAIAGVIRHAGTRGSAAFPDAIRGLLLLICPFDSMVITRYRRDSPPDPLYNDLDPLNAAVTVELYTDGHYLNDPFFLVCKDAIPTGAFRLGELAPDDFHRSAYYQDFFRKLRLRDEIGIFVKESHDQWILLSLARKSQKPRFAAGDCAAFNGIYQLVAAALLRQWGRRPTDDPMPKPLGRQIGEFGTGILSPRESDVIHLILLGHTSAAIADHLGIAEGTVKVHRRHAYAKLGISSQVELFSAAASSLAV